MPPWAMGENYGTGAGRHAGMTDNHSAVPRERCQKLSVGPGVDGAKLLKTKKHYLDRAAYMRQLARTAQTEKLRESALKAAEQLEHLAKIAGQEEAGGGDD